MHAEFTCCNEQANKYGDSNTIHLDVCDVPAWLAEWPNCYVCQDLQKSINSIKQNNNSNRNKNNNSTNGSGRTSSIRMYFVLTAEVLLTTCLLGTVHSLAPGHHRPYDSLCISNALAIPTPWDCGGFIRCETTAGAGASAVPKAMWVVCDPGKQYDHRAGQCVTGYTGCLAPQSEFIRLGLTFCCC